MLKMEKVLRKKVFNDDKKGQELGLTPKNFSISSPPCFLLKKPSKLLKKFEKMGKKFDFVKK